jgi:hypothetical protein
MNTKSRNCLDAYNNNCLKELAKKISEAKWAHFSGKVIAFIMTPIPLHQALKRLQALIKQGIYPATTFIKPHKAPKIN